MLTVDQLRQGVVRALGADIVHDQIDRNELCVVVRRNKIADALLILRDDPAIAMNQLMDICGADYPERPERFDVVYNLLSLKNNIRMRVKVHTSEHAVVPTATGVYSSAGWFERETWDMFGIAFAGNQDLRRILTDYGFEGHPLRKDFPMCGYVEVRYDQDQKRIVQEPVKIAREYREFDFISPWEGQ